MNALPVLSTPCTGDELDARLATLSALGEAQATRAARAAIGALLLFGSLIAGVVCLLVFASRPFTYASGSLFALGTLLLLYRVSLGRWSVGARWIWLGLVTLAFGLGVAVTALPTPAQAVAALDLRAFPAEVITAVALSLTGVLGALVWDAAKPPDRTGAMEQAIVQYAATLARPLLHDAAAGARGLLRLSPFAPASDHWRVHAEGDLTLRTLERLVCEVQVPLEGGERFVLQVSESITTRTRQRRNARGKLKIKPKGHVRSIEARLSWSLSSRAPSSADLTAHLVAHLQSARVPTHDVQLRARGEQASIDVRLVRALRRANADGWDEPDWLGVALIHESARFLSVMRSRLAQQAPPQQGRAAR